MLLIELEGPIRDFMIILDTIYIIIFLELAVLFFYQSFKKKSNLNFNIAWAVFFASFAIVGAMASYQRYFMPAELWVQYEDIYRLIGLVPLVFTVGLMEYIFQKYRKTYFIVTILAVIDGLLVIFEEGLIAQIIFNVFLIVLLLFGIIFFKKLISLTSGKMRRNMTLFVILIITLLIAENFRSETAIQNVIDLRLNAISYLAAIYLILISTVLGLAFILFKIPIFLELDWKENLIQIYVIQREVGVPIYHARFQKTDESPNQEEVDEDLVAGGMVGISTMLKEISKSTEDLKVIDHGDQHIMLEHSQHIFIALLVKKVMRIYWEKVRSLSRSIEQYYGHILEHWDGALEYFKPLEGIVSQLFEQTS